MNEQRIAYRIRQALNKSAQDVSPTALRRLEAARHLALSKQKQTTPGVVLAGSHGQFSLGGGRAHPYLRHILSVLALLVGMWISFYWHSHEYVNELVDVDSALLADDLPPEAFLDNDFFEWLKDDDSSAQ